MNSGVTDDGDGEGIISGKMRRERQAEMDGRRGRRGERSAGEGLVPLVVDKDGKQT